ncbi:AAA domain-containing protein [Aliarcobacter cryaerophilus]|uniref:AAA domain-containing protein n=1 Tax=Aliarcobacter cryaerophilus TaxID=28198 RepID=UPI0021B5FE50|nr:AAA domain-containing protein [Aliarcobacter cryaerophilus]MCT7518910.1 AAA domain-containing protein [Aliarcobacter cryaerophilus]
MILDAIKTDTTFRVEARNLSQERIPNSGVGFLRKTNHYAIFINEKIYEIEIIDKNKLNEIDFFFSNRSYTALVNIIESIRDKFLTIEIIFLSFPTKEIFVPFYIELDEKILETAKKKQLARNIKELGEKLKKRISFKINNEEYFIVSTAISSQKEIFEEEFAKIRKNLEEIDKSTKLTDEEKEKYTEENKEALEQIRYEKKDLAFSVHGENLHLPVRKEITQSGDYQFKATKLVSFKNAIKKDTLRLIKGDIVFKNGLVSEKIAKELGDIVEEDGSYLKTWDIYLEKEGEILLDKAKEVGVIKIIDTRKIEDGYELKIENSSNIDDLLNEGDYLSITDEVPSYINDNLTWIEHIAQLEQEDKINIKQTKNQSFEIIKIEHGFIDIKTDKNISELKAKKIVLSIYGDEIQLKRKLEARKRLLEGRSANPVLGLIIEDSDKIQNYLKQKKTNKLEPLTSYIENKIFSNPPTQNQIEAIDIALNTPDIAIIQGPPGTGKTTVLTAVIERLNEESDKENIKGQILVAGFQHDAVENIIQRLDINGIPTPKFGKKSSNETDISSYERVMVWSEKIATKIKEKMPALSNQNKINKLNQHFEIYLKTPSQHLANNILNYIEEISFDLDDDIVESSRNILKEITIKQIDNMEDLKAIYALRTTEEAFLDDGKERNLALLVSSIGNFLEENEKKLLQQTQIVDIKSYLAELIKLKFSLIDRYYPKPIFRAEKPNEDIVKLKELVEKKLSYGISDKDKTNTILADYLNELECNPFGLKSMIEEYSYVYSSTTGQSNQATKQKMNNEDEDVSFDTVIIDEAARVAPMDLLVAMVLAKRRIILVGDHRQLPHMVDEEVIKKSDLSENEYINESIFGYLKKRAKKLETYDNIKRAITLNNQYRTHPMLGKFVSDNFYKKHGESFDSPLGTTIGKVEDYFNQRLEGIENTPAIWLDVSNKECKEQRAWSRKCEAQKIVEYLKKWIFSKEGEDLTFGIITFYRNQVNLINNLIKEQFTKEERDIINRRLSDGSERLRVGTVDSFQGMEFDIVFLSIVRSRDIKTISDKLKDYNLFGFLVSKNRLCVSMSRQKKSLIVVGDKEFFDSNRAKIDVEELYNFLQLCKEEGKVIENN